MKIAHTMYVAVLVPAYWRYYGPRNFLWFSDLALVGLAPALWREDPRLMSMIGLSALLPEIPWNLGYFARLLTGRELFGLSHYIFDRRKPLLVRALSLFHVWLPPLVLWSVRRLGYDGRAFRVQALAGEAVLFASYALTRPEENVNWVLRAGSEAAKENLAGPLLMRRDDLLPALRLVADPSDPEPSLRCAGYGNSRSERASELTR